MFKSAYTSLFSFKPCLNMKETTFTESTSLQKETSILRTTTLSIPLFYTLSLGFSTETSKAIESSELSRSEIFKLVLGKTTIPKLSYTFLSTPLP